MKRSSLFLPAACAYAILSLSGPIATAQIDNTTPEWKTQQERGQMEDAANQAAVKTVKVPKEVKVSVEVDKPRGVMAPWVMAVHGLASDPHLSDPEVIQLLRAAGITTVRYPGGRIADTYHFSVYHPSNWQGLDHPNIGYAPANDLGSFVKFMEQVGTTIFTVNYGSNLAGTGPGEPSEAAAWVAYVNGNPADTKMIPKDSAGNDWQTVGYWAGLRAAAPLPTDDGKNFLRIGHAAPLGIRYWEIGNEVYENGYFGGEGLEEDLHAAYPKEAKENARQRKKNGGLGPEAYGKNFVLFAQAMKAVDPRIKVGVSLDKPLAGQINRDEWTQDPVTGKYQQNTSVSVKEDFNRGIDWDKGVLSAACNEVDFVALHWSISDTTQDSGFRDLDNNKLLAAPQDTLRPILAGLLDQLQKNCGARARGIQVAFTEVGVASYVKVPEPVVPGLFAADLYPSLVEYGVINADWSELHNGGFLDEHNKPGAPYFGMQMVHAFMNFNDTVVAASSSSSVLSVHASKRGDGSVGVMLINKDGKNATTVKLQINGGAALGAKGMRFDYGKTNPPDGLSVQGKAMEGLSNSMSIPMPPYTATVIIIPKAQ
jgi:alpha-L-arabinofuranosidase